MSDQIQNNSSRKQNFSINLENIIEDIPSLQLKNYKLFLKQKSITRQPLTQIQKLKNENTHWDNLLLQAKLMALDFFEERKWKKGACYLMARHSSLRIEKVKSNEKLTELYKRSLCLHRSIVINNVFKEISEGNTQGLPINNYLKKKLNQDEIRSMFSKWKLSLRLIKLKLMKAFGDSLYTKAKEIVKLIGIIDNLIKIHEVKTRKALSMNVNSTIKSSSLNFEEIDDNDALDLNTTFRKTSNFSDVSIEDMPSKEYGGQGNRLKSSNSLTSVQINSQFYNGGNPFESPENNSTDQGKPPDEAENLQDRYFNGSQSSTAKPMNKLYFNITEISNELNQIILEFNKEVTVKLKDEITFKKVKCEPPQENDEKKVNQHLAAQNYGLGKGSVSIQGKRQVAFGNNPRDIGFGFSPLDLFYEIDTQALSVPITLENDTTVSSNGLPTLQNSFEKQESNHISPPPIIAIESEQDFIATIEKNIKGTILYLDEKDFIAQLNSHSLNSNQVITNSIEHQLNKLFPCMFSMNNKPDKNVLNSEAEINVKRYDKKFEQEPALINHYNLKFEKFTKIQELILLYGIREYGSSISIIVEVPSILPLSRSLQFEADEVYNYLDRTLELKYGIDLLASCFDYLNMQKIKVNKNHYSSIKSVYNIEASLLTCNHSDHFYNSGLMEYIYSQETRKKFINTSIYRNFVSKYIRKRDDILTIVKESRENPPFQSTDGYANYDLYSVNEKKGLTLGSSSNLDNLAITNNTKSGKIPIFNVITNLGLKETFTIQPLERKESVKTEKKKRTSKHLSSKLNQFSELSTTSFDNETQFFGSTNLILNNNPNKVDLNFLTKKRDSSHLENVAPNPPLVYSSKLLNSEPSKLNVELLTNQALLESLRNAFKVLKENVNNTQNSDIDFNRQSSQDYHRYNLHMKANIFKADTQMNKIRLLADNPFIETKNFQFKKQSFQDLKKNLIDLLSFKTSPQENVETNIHAKYNIFMQETTTVSKERKNAINQIHEAKDTFSVRRSFNDILRPSHGIGDEEILDGVTFFSQKSISKEWDNLKSPWYQNNYQLKPIFRKVPKQPFKNDNTNFQIGSQIPKSGQSLNQTIRNLSDN